MDISGEPRLGIGATRRTPREPEAQLVENHLLTQPILFPERPMQT